MRPQKKMHIYCDYNELKFLLFIKNNNILLLIIIS